MAKTITQKVLFKNTTTSILYQLYMDSKKHSTATASQAKITSKEGGKFTAHGGSITGKNLQLIKDKLIVQSWRINDWDTNDIDSTFILSFEQKGKDAILNMVHANIPDKHAKHIDKGWKDYYWTPWKKHLAGKTIKHPKM
jgi:activator of HSP90 ATPase